MSRAPDGARLLDDLRTFVGRFVAPPRAEALDAIVLWAAHAHMAGYFYTSPRLALLSPEPGSGKTRVLEVLYPVVARPMFSFSASPAAIFRKLAQEDHTLLFDEVDAIFTRQGKDDGNEDLRALLNAGYRRGATIPRCVGPRHEVQEFGVFAPVALAGLGDLPDTVMSRSVIIRMRRRAPSERIEQFRMRIHEAEGALLRERLATWTAEVGPDVGEAWPDLPPGVVDRDAEVWEPLLAVADAAGGHWPDTARTACVELLKVASDREVSLGVRLLGDLRAVFADADALATSDILEALNDLDEAPWGDLYGKKLEARTLARMLKRYDVSSTTVKVGGKALRGYRRENLWDTWERYLAPAPAEVQPPQPASSGVANRVGDDIGQVAHASQPHATPAQPVQPPAVAQVAHVTGPSQHVQPRERVQDASSAEVAEVALAREPGRSLAERAAVTVATLRDLEVADLRRRYAQAAQVLVNRINLPDWINSTAKAEPVQVTATLELIAEDARADRAPRPWPAYLAAARDAYSAAGGRP